MDKQTQIIDNIVMGDISLKRAEDASLYDEASSYSTTAQAYYLKDIALSLRKLVERNTPIDAGPR